MFVTSAHNKHNKPQQNAKGVPSFWNVLWNETSNIMLSDLITWKFCQMYASHV